MRLIYYRGAVPLEVHIYATGNTVTEIDLTIIYTYQKLSAETEEDAREITKRFNEPYQDIEGLSSKLIYQQDSLYKP